MLFVMAGHEPVLLDEVREFLSPVPGGAYLDLTFGGGGHSRAILESAPGIWLTAFDQDPEARERVANLELDFPGQITFHEENFTVLSALCEEEAYDGILMDLGVSSFQFDDPERGFSFREEARPDMRMNPDQGVPVWQFLEEAAERDLVAAIRDYGEERHWRKIVRAIVGARGTGRLQSTRELASLIAEQIPIRKRVSQRIHPATQAFQGLRIAINDELQALDKTLPQAWACLKPGGVLAAISFHSLEDRLVKRFFREKAGQPVDRFDSRVQEERRIDGELLTRRPIEPTEREIVRNSRSRSARLRVIRKGRRAL